MIRAPGICNGDDATTVLCHMNGGGMGAKTPDLIAAWGCSDCHDAIDGRRYGLERDYRELLAHEGMRRTIEQLIKDGVVTW
jgi:hypothetical protein